MKCKRNRFALLIFNYIPLRKRVYISKCPNNSFFSHFFISLIVRCFVFFFFLVCLIGKHDLIECQLTPFHIIHLNTHHTLRNQIEWRRAKSDQVGLKKPASWRCGKSSVKRQSVVSNQPPLATKHSAVRLLLIAYTLPVNGL